MKEKFTPNNHQAILTVERQDKESVESINPLYRGVWADKLSDGQKLPVGGSIFSDKLTTNLELDFVFFDDQLSNFTEEKMRAVYEQHKESVIDWLKKINSDIDPYTYFLCYQTQQKTQKLLEIDENKPTDSHERRKLYCEEKPPQLSELIGKTECAERAALAQYIMQKMGAESSYVSGITMRDAGDVNEDPENHSFIVLKHPNKTGASLIFDIARPRTEHNIPRLLETDNLFSYDLLKGKSDLLVEATEVLQGGKTWFGVGDAESGEHNVIKKGE